MAIKAISRAWGSGQDTRAYDRVAFEQCGMMEESSARIYSSALVESPALRGRQLLLLTLAAASALYVRTALSPLQEAMRAALMLNDNQMALLQGPALALPVVLITIPLGALVDRYSRVRLLLIFAVLGFIGSVLTAAAGGFAALFFARCLTGLTAPATWIAASSLIGDLYLPAQRGRTTMILAIGQFVGMSGAFALGGALLARLGGGLHECRLAMLWLSSPMLIVMIALMALREPPRTGVVIQNPALREILSEVWGYRAIVAPLFVGIVMLEIAYGAVLVWTVPAFSRHFVALTPDRLGELMGVALAVSGLLGPIVGGALADYGQRTGGPRRTVRMLGAFVLISTPAGLFAIMPGLGAAVGLALLFMTAASAILVTGTTLFTIVVPNEVRGFCMAILTGTSVLCGLGLSPLTVSLLSGAIGGPSMIGAALAVSCAGASLVGAISFAVGWRCIPQNA